MDQAAAITVLLSASVHGFYVKPQRWRATHPVHVLHRGPQLWRHNMMDDTLSSTFDENSLDDLDFDESLDLLGVDDVLEMLLLEDSMFQEDDLSSPDAFSVKDAPKEQSLDHADVVEEVLRLLDDTSPGGMDVNEIGLLRNVMQGLAANAQEPYSSETAQKIEKILLRMLDEYDSAKKTKDSERMKFAEPRAEDFAMVCILMIDSLSHPNLQVTQYKFPGHASLVR
jgi:hypothetical protein